MHDKRVITLHIPDEDDFDERYGRIAAPELVVDSTIDLLAGILVQWKAEVGSQPDERVWAALMTAVGHALGGLIAARAARFYETGGRVVVEQIDEYLNWSGAREDLQAVRSANNAFIVDALLALEEESERRRKEQQQAAKPSQQRPVGDDDDRAGWDF